MTDGMKAFFIVAILIAGGAVAYLSFGGIGENLVYYWTPTELAEHGDQAQGAVVRLGGMVEAGSLKWDKAANELTFKVSDGETSIDVHGTGVPPQMFREGIGVVVEGTMGGNDVFESDRLLVKHDNEYQAPEGEADMDELKKSLQPES
jgi:cytochrome c-type biogenesis protein CcmE